MSKFTSLLCFAGLVGVACAQSNSIQSPDVFELLSQNKPMMTADKMADMLRSAVPGQTFPTLSEIPITSFSCNDVGQGYFADVETGCQVFRRCDLRGVMSSFLCTNGTLFNQITLVCDWWYNVPSCDQAKNYYNYANSRLYLQNGAKLFDTPASNNWQDSSPSMSAQSSSFSFSRNQEQGFRRLSGTSTRRRVRVRRTTGAMMTNADMDGFS
ncbi:hypothetical protein RvY_04885 [Ramazzottius varieornatus]|uniref:Chitin-binding type-2 domain-containing protein n=1 Tax=Ramazzottius varieornatus TaxID=947166 RepID=A0A1D1UT77_RAMVA|nr:hypothetical protein RvY_04885 [Ramazzottius varieornatus]